MKAALDLFRATGCRCFLPLWDAIYAEILVRAGRTDEALAVLENAEKEMAETAESWCIPEWHRVYAIVHYSRQMIPHATGKFQQAADIAQKQGSVNWLDRVNKSREKLRHNKGSSL
jgi:hypothetical protein